MDMLIKYKIAQITSEYAILVAVIVAALMAMQIYTKRAIQARVKDAIDYPVTSGAFNTGQYEPFYVDSSRVDITDSNVSQYERGVFQASETITTMVVASNAVSNIN